MHWFWYSKAGSLCCVVQCGSRCPLQQLTWL